MNAPDKTEDNIVNFVMRIGNDHASKHVAMAYQRIIDSWPCTMETVLLLRDLHLSVLAEIEAKKERQ